MNTELKNMPDPKEQMLWEIARKRASFKSHLFSYIVVNCFLWALWYFGDGYDSGKYPWPIWPTLGWGIGLVFHFIGAYIYPQEDAVQREYEKLKNQK
jgi:hypothetical protein